MKLTIICLVVSIFSVQARSYSQKTKITLDLNNVKIRTVFDKIQSQTEFKFLYNHKKINDQKLVSVQARNRAVSEILDSIFKESDIYYTVKKKQIILKLRPVSSKSTFPQTKVENNDQDQLQVSGQVKDKNDIPVPGVNILVKGTNKGVVTDWKGNYKITVPGDVNILVFSYVGFLTKEEPINNRSVIDVILEEDVATLDEVVVVGYGTQKKSDLTGSVVGIKSDDITKSKSTSFLGGIQGKMAGVRISSSSGEPGAASNITIRGSSSVYGSSSPLFVIDGIPVDMNENEVASASIGNGQSYDPLSSISPSDIESIEVLKDASATAIYGSRGANGVVIVTTKSGKPGALRMVFDSYTGISTQAKKLDVLSAEEYIDYRRVKDPNSVLFYTDSNNDGSYDELDEPRDPYALPSHDWQDEILRTAVTQSHTLSITGGTEKTQYSGSLGYLNEEGIVKNNNYQRYNMRLKVDHKQSEKLKLGINLNTSYSELNGATQSGGGAGIFNGIVQNLVISRPVEIYVPSWDLEGQYISPLSMVDEAKKNNSLTRNYLRSYLEYKPVKGLSFRSSVGGTLSNSKGKEFYGSNTSWGNRDNGRGIIQGRKAISWYNTNQITYNKKFKNQSLTVMGAFEINQYDFERFLVENANFPDESTGINDISKGTNAKRILSNRWASKRLSYLGRLNYSLLDRYLVTASFRADGSDKFGTGNRYGYFPSFAFAWRVTEERFMKQQKLFNNLKLRLSYGQTGNERIPAYQYFARMGNTYYDGQLGLAPESFSNPELKWESTTQYNAGTDMALFNSRIELSADYYIKQTDDMLLPAYVSSQSGYNRQWQNIGRVDNEGIELQITSRNVSTKNFKWTTDLSVSRNKNTVKDLGGVDFIPVLMSGGWITNVGRVIEGESLGTAYGYVFDGVYQIDDFNWQNNNDPEIPHEQRQYMLKDGVVSVNGAVVQPGSFRFSDLTDDGVVDEDDKTVISHSAPEHFGGITNTFQYKNIELSFFLEWSYGNEVFNESRWRLEGGVPQTWMNISRDFWYNRWTPDNPTNTYGTFSNDTENKTSLLASSYYVEDASWLRLKNISFSYVLPKQIVRALGLSNIRLYCIGNNLVTWTKYTGFDPEINSGNPLLPGFDRISYPRAKSFILGINVSF